MSKINAVRFINLNYNHNMIRVSDETLYFNGDSTLIKLDNGGGKSVLVMMTLVDKKLVWMNLLIIRIHSKMPIRH